MAKDLIIQAPQTGISQSPHLGNGDCRNLDLNTIPGIARLNNLLAKKSSTTVTGLIKWFVKDPVTPANCYAIDDAGVVYSSTDSGDTWATLGGHGSGGTGQGLAIWKDYLFAPRATAMDLYGPLSSSPAWRNSWAGLTMDTDSLWHPMIVSSNDNKLYGGAGKFVFSIDEVTAQTFLWSNAATYTVTAQALDLPPNYRIKCLEEQGNNLMIGTWMGTNVYDFKIADIFPWDRSSPSFGLPIKLNENGVHAMLNISGLLYVVAGIEGKLYLSNGVTATEIAQIPSSIANLEGGLYLEPMPGAIASYKGRLFFGLSVGGTSNIGGMGVWSLRRTATGNILTIEHTISENVDGLSEVVKIGALLGITRDTLLVSFRNASTYGIDKTTNNLRYTSYRAYFESAFYTVGTPLVKRQFSQGEFLLAKKLASGEGIKVKFRTDLNASFVTLGTFDFATLGAVLSHQFIADIPESEMVQVRVELTTGSSNSSPQFKLLVLR